GVPEPLLRAEPRRVPRAEALSGLLPIEPPPGRLRPVDDADGVLRAVADRLARPGGSGLQLPGGLFGELEREVLLRSLRLLHEGEPGKRRKPGEPGFTGPSEAWPVRRVP